jgi:formate dehydrogenase maturation protein FdhE
MIHIPSLIDDTKCFATVRALRWPEGIYCPRCGSFEMTKQGRDDTQPERQRYLCQACERRWKRNRFMCYDLSLDHRVGHFLPLSIMA